MVAEFDWVSFTLAALLTTFFDGAEDSVTTVTLYDYIEEIEENTGNHYNVDDLYVAASSLFWIAAVFSGFFFGWLTNFFSIKFCLVSSYTITAVGNVLYLMAQNNSSLLVVIGRWFDGIGYGNKVLSIIYLKRVISDEQTYASYAAMIGVSLYTGLLLGALLAIEIEFTLMTYKFSNLTYGIFFLLIGILTHIALTLTFFKEPSVSERERDQLVRIWTYHEMMQFLMGAEIARILFFGVINSMTTGLAKFGIRPFSSDLFEVSTAETSLMLSGTIFSLLLLLLVMSCGIINIEKAILGSITTFGIGIFLTFLIQRTTEDIAAFVINNICLYICGMFVNYHIEARYTTLCNLGPNPGVIMAIWAARDCFGKVLAPCVYGLFYRHDKPSLLITFGVAYGAMGLVGISYAKVVYNAYVEKYVRLENKAIEESDLVSGNSVLYSVECSKSMAAIVA